MIDDFDICSELRQYLCDIFLCLGFGSCRGPRADHFIEILVVFFDEFHRIDFQTSSCLKIKDIQRKRFSISVEFVFL